MFHIAIGERGLLYPEVYYDLDFKTSNMLERKMEFRERCVEKNYPVTVEIIGVFPSEKEGLAEEFLEVYLIDSFTIVWVVPSSFLMPLFPRR